MVTTLWLKQPTCFCSVLKNVALVFNYLQLAKTLTKQEDLGMMLAK